MKYNFILISLIIVAQFSDASMVYTKREIILGNSRVKLHAAEFTLDDYSLQIVKAMEGKLGSESLRNMVNRYNPVVATNGTFFKSYHGSLEGVASWLLKAQSDIYATAGNYPVFYISGNEYGIIQTMVSPYIKVGDKTLDVLSLNAPDMNVRNKRFIAPIHIVNNSYWHKTMTVPGSLEALFSYRGHFLTSSMDGNNRIPENGFALIAEGDKGQEVLESLPQNVQLSYGVQYSAEQLQHADYIISGSDIILQEGKVAKYIARYKGDNSFINGRHARTAICIRTDNSIGLYVVEDRAKKMHEEMSVKDILSQLQDLGYSMPQIRKMPIAAAFAKVRDASSAEYVGVTLQEFAEILQEHGCNYALNLDGGSSSVMAYEGELSNIFTPIDNPDLVGKRTIGDAIMVFAKDKGKNN